MELKIRDGHALINGDKTEFVCESGTIDIIGPDGRTLFGIDIYPDYSIRIDGGDTVKVGDNILDSKFIIIPVASNCVTLRKQVYGIKESGRRDIYQSLCTAQD